MKILDTINYALASRFITDFDNTDNKQVRVNYGLLAGWASILATVSLFVLKMILGLVSGSVSIIANAFHLLSHLANSIILVVTFWATARPATAKNPFGHGRMEHLAPLIMSIFLFVSGIQLAERSFHQALDPHELHFWTALPWILLASIVVKQWLSQFITYLGNRVHSHAILINAFHHKIEAVMSLTVIGGLVASHNFHHPEIDGYIGILVSLWLLYLGFTHAKEAIVPLLGQAPSKDMIAKIRETAKSVDGVEDVHEIIVHDYGSMYMMSMHVEIPEKFNSAEMHEIAERCERKLRKHFGGEVVCHTDPLLEMTPEIQAIEDQFRRLVEDIPKIIGYHDFRVIAESSKKVIIAADIDIAEEVPETDFKFIRQELAERILREIPNIAYSTLYITPKYAY
ncbi:MAG: cation diffusion facilitator family transporter [Candidatus Aminicenantes bacterium]|jgi:cation diffusion facilitator family transporter